MVDGNEKGNSRIRLAADIGGTFTDVAAFDENSGSLLLGKSLSTPDHLVEGELCPGVLSLPVDSHPDVRAQDPIREARIVLNVSCDRELPAGLGTFDDQGFEVCPGGVESRRKSGGAGA